MQSNWKPLFCIKIPCIPVGQPRARATVRKLKNGKVRAGMYDPKTIKQANGKTKPHPIVEFKNRVRRAVERFHTAEPLTCPVRIKIEAVFPRPKGMCWKRRETPRVPHTQTPDTDNIAKAVMDALNGILWRDDCLVQTQTCEKWIAAGDEAPHVVLAVWTFEGERA